MSHDDNVLWRAEEHEDVTGRAWDDDAAREAIAAIVADALASQQSDGTWPGHPRDELRPEEEGARSLYLGAGGMIWGLARLGADLDAAAAIAEAVRAYRAHPDFGGKAHPPSLWMGETGLLAVAAALDSAAADPARLEELVRANRSHPTWELLWGSPGTILAARDQELAETWQESAELLWAARDAESGLWTQDMYGSVCQYLGAGHGFATCVHALRGHVDDESLRAHTARVLGRTALREDGLVNWPPLPDAPANAIRVQWCHGAPGIVAVIGDLLPDDLLRRAGELVWRAGPLRKGPGLCHGTAGNGLALLKLHVLTGDPLWLDRARSFARHAIGQVERERCEVGRGRYTLWTGDVGVALFLDACLEGRAEVPTLDGFGIGLARDPSRGAAHE